MKAAIGHGWRKDLSNGQYLDISTFASEWTTQVNMSVWEEGNPSALKVKDCCYFNFDKVLPIKIARLISMKLLNKQSQEVAGIDLIEVKE